LSSPPHGAGAGDWRTSHSFRREILQHLQTGEMTLTGLLARGSNYTFLADIAHSSGTVGAIYKPARGERPLWDFEWGSLAAREAAAYVVCEALDWGFVPPTVLRDGPHGPGSVQLYVDLAGAQHYLKFRHDPAYWPELGRLALFDIVINNADRKSGHCLRLGSGQVAAIDHGVCFHESPKLRTVIWDFAGRPVPTDAVGDLKCLSATLADSAHPLRAQLDALLSPVEIAAMGARVRALLGSGRFPQPPEDRRPYPWPLV